jgi:O-antigen/teichoic acid export membrane protein
MIQNTLLTLAGVAQLSTGYAATKFVAEFRFTDKERTGRIIGLSSVVSGIMGFIATLVLIVCASWLASNTLKAPHLAPGLLIASGSVLFSVLNGYQIGALAGLENYGTIARVGALHGILHLIVCSVAALLWGLNGALAGYVASALLRWLIFHRALLQATSSQAIRYVFQGIWEERNIIFRFALPAALSGFFSMPALWLINTFLVKIPDGYSQMGLYSAANSLKTIILILPQLINNVGMSLMNSQKGLGNQRNYRQLFWFNLAMTAGIVLLGVLFVVFSGDWLLRMYGKDFVAGHTVLLVLIISTIPEALALAAYQVIQTQGKMWLSFTAVVLPRDCTNILAAYFLIPLFGAAGMASAYTISQIVAFFCITAIVARVGLDCDSNQSAIKGA